MKNVWSKITAIPLKYWLLIAAGIFLMIMAFRSCNNLPSHKQEGKNMDSLQIAYASEKAADLHRIAELSFQKDSIQDRFDSLDALYKAVKQDASARVSAVRQNLASGADAIAKHDTLWRLQNCDSLRAQVAAGLPVIAAQDSLCQAMVNACMAEGGVKDSLISSYATLWRKADTAYSQQRAAYVGLYSDYNKANSGLKFNKTLSRGLALALLVAGAKIFIFK